MPGSTRLADDFIVKELKFQGANRCYDQMIAIGETVTKEQIEDLCEIMYQYALKQCQTREERKAAKPLSQKNLIYSAKVQVAIYDDRLEVTSPGMLIGGVTIEELKEGYSRPRNRGIVTALTYMKNMDQWVVVFPD